MQSVPAEGMSGEQLERMVCGASCFFAVLKFSCFAYGGESQQMC